MSNINIINFVDNSHQFWYVNSNYLIYKTQDINNQWTAFK